jgi:hypothetical protein
MRAFSDFEAQARRAERAAMLLIACAGVDVALVLLSLRVVTQAELEAFRLAVDMWSLAVAVPLVLRLGLYVVWFTRAFDWGVYLTRAPALKARREQGLVWIFLVPVVAHFRPFVALMELEAALERARRGSSTKEARPPLPSLRRLIRGWWASSVAATLLVLASIATQAEVTLFVLLGAGLLHGGANLLSLLVVRRITARLRKLARRNHALG